MIADYTADPDHYSDGSPVGVEYIPDDVPIVISYKPLPPPHRGARSQAQEAVRSGLHFVQQYRRGV